MLTVFGYCAEVDIPSEICMQPATVSLFWLAAINRVDEVLVASFEAKALVA